MSPVFLFQLAARNAQWLSARQSAIASNVANASSPGYRAKDIQPFAAVLDSSEIAMTTTDPAHLEAGATESGAFREIEVDAPNATLSGNSVNVETEMIKLGDVNRGYALTTNVQRAFHQLLLASVK